MCWAGWEAVWSEGKAQSPYGFIAELLNLNFYSLPDLHKEKRIERRDSLL